MPSQCSVPTANSACGEAPPAERSASSRPLVSVILAVCNEAAKIEQCLASLLAQQAPDFDLEFFAVDGRSTDGTVEILDRLAIADSRVKVLTNERRRTPFAFNLGLQEARGEYVCILGAHTEYSHDYISTCWHQLLARGVAGCGGRVVTRPAVNTLQARLVAAALAHPFGSSRKSFRTQPEGFVDTVNYPVLRKAPLLEAGGYDETLLRNQDNDMSQKLLAAGHRLYCTWKTQCFYHPQSTARALLSYAFRNGYWNVISLRKNAASMAARHFFPFIFLLGLLAAGLLAAASPLLTVPYPLYALLPLITLLGTYLAVAALAATQVAVRDRFGGAAWLPLVFLGLHLAYGSGTLCALVAGAGIPRQDDITDSKGRLAHRDAAQHSEY